MLKPWPKDAVIIVAATPDKAVLAQMDGQVSSACRDCGKALLADTYTVGKAEAMPERVGRPVEFLCLACFAGYDFGQVTHAFDHRFHKLHEGN